MKILFISHKATVSGAPLALLAVLKSLHNNKDLLCDVLVMQDGDLKERFTSVAKNVFLYKEPDNKLKARIIRRIKSLFNIKEDEFDFLKNRRYELIYANTIASLKLGCYIKQRTGISLIAHIHESEYMLATYKATKEMFQMCDKIISVSALSQNALINNYSVNPDIISVVYPFSPFINYETIPKITKEKIFEGELIIGLSGYCSWVKGTDLLPLVIKKFSELYPDIDAKFVWVGSQNDNFEPKLNYELSKLGLQTYIYFVGSTNNPLKYYQGFDIFLLLSREESFSLSALECAYLGKPVISMENASGINDLLKQDAGIIVPFLSIDKIAETIYKLYIDKTYAERLGKKAQQLVVSQFHKNKSLKTIQQIFFNK